MIPFKKYQLPNGLRLIVHEDDSTPMACVNLLYNVGACDETPGKTGFAHLFEHLMFGGSEHAPDFDHYVQTAGGDSNAFTNNDVTNYYETMPAENVGLALWLEADRMASLNINERSLEVQRKVVVEEFNETCLNIPYGDAWHHIVDLAFKQHPYRWPTIGRVPQHVQEANLGDVRDFYKKYYAPNNAILVVAGAVDTEEVKRQVEKYFGHIPPSAIHPRNLPQEPPQEGMRRLMLRKNVPLDAIYMVFHTVERRHPDYHAVDLLSDLLCNGKSSRLFRKVKKELELFADIDTYITGNFDPGLLVIEGRLAEDVDVSAAESAIWEVVEDIKSGNVSERELQKYKNKAVSGLVFNECNLMNRAMNLAFYETLGDAEIINGETESYKNVRVADIIRVANDFLDRKNCSVVEYLRKGEE